jgi:PAS domain S-box-containing protein
MSVSSLLCRLPGPRPAELPLAVLAARMKHGVVILDRTGCIRFCNRALLRLFGCSDTDVTGRPLVDLLPAESRAPFLARWQDRRAGATQSYTLQWQRGDGEAVVARVEPLPLFSDSGDFDGSLALIEDASEQRRLDAELATARAIIESASMVMYRARLEEGLPIEFVSGNVAYFGYLTENLTSGLVGFVDIVHPADARRVIDELHRRVAAGEREFTQHYRIRTGGGETLWVEDRTCVRIPVAGGAICLEGIISDVTERHRADVRLRRALTQTIGAIAATIDKRDPYTAGHQRRVANLSRAIGAQLGLAADRLEGLYLGALVHDVGKLAIPVDILTRPGRLSPEEFALVKTHVQAGVEVLRDVDFPWPITAMIAQHHERLDGSGYPAGLVAEAIGLEARIIAVADVFESMSTHRPYRAALGTEAALAELVRGQVQLFDVTAVDACRSLLESHAGDLQSFWTSLEAPAVPVVAPDADVECAAAQDQGRD